MAVSLEKQIEAILFFKSEPMRADELARLLGTTPDAVRAALGELETALAGRGIRLLRKDDEAALGTAADASPLIERITKEELSRDLGKAAVETLAIVLYRGPVTKAEIDYIRGVNAGFIVRSLLVRGLIERISNPKDQRSFLYRPTFDLLAHMGAARVEDLPDYAAARARFTAFEESMEREAAHAEEEERIETASGIPPTEPPRDTPQ